MTRREVPYGAGIENFTESLTDRDDDDEPGIYGATVDELDRDDHGYYYDAFENPADGFIERDGDARDARRTYSEAQDDAWIEYRRLRAIVDGHTRAAAYDPDADELERLTDHLLGETDYWDEDPDRWWWHETFGSGLPPDDWRPPAPKAPKPKGPSLDDVLRERLTEAEYQHVGWLRAERPQADIARDLGISQPAVTKRERKLRAKVDEIATEVTGRGYPWLRRSQKKGGRPRLS